MEQFATKPAIGSVVSNPANTKTVTSIQKPNPMVAAIGIQDDECVVISIYKNEATLPEDKIGNLFQDTFSKEELDDEWLQSSLQALQTKPPVIRHLPMSCKYKLVMKEMQPFQ